MNEFEITIESKWENVNNFLMNNIIWRKAEQFDKLVAYEEFMRELTKNYDDNIQRQRKRIERKRRENFT